jgi:ATP-dependent Lhr-like helicase
MELAGELIAGRFFSGINSLQFASPSIMAELEEAESLRGIYWMNATDPASLAGLEIEGLPYRLCNRAVNNRIYFRNDALIAMSSRNNRDMQLFMEPDDPDMAILINLIKIARTRKVLPETNVLIEKINGQTAGAGVFVPVFKDSGFISDRGKLYFWPE